MKLFEYRVFGAKQSVFLNPKGLAPLFSIRSDNGGKPLWIKNVPSTRYQRTKNEAKIFQFQVLPEKTRVTWRIFF
jgi:hypothetical protein